MREFEAAGERGLPLSARGAVFEAAVSSLTDGFAIVDASGRFTFYNKAFADNLEDGRRSGLAVGAAAGPVLGFEIGSAPSAARLERVVDDGRWISVRCDPTPDGGAVLLLHDVTDAKLSELQIRDNEARYRAVVDTQTEMVARYRPDGVTTFVNSAYCRYMKMSAEELTGADVNGFTCIVPEDLPAHEAHIRALKPDNPSATIIFRAVLPDGEMHWEEWTDTGLFAADGTLVEMQSVGRDITEKRRAEEAMRRSEAELERQRAAMHQNEKLAALGSLLAGVAHEMNNPLSIVVGYSGMLVELAPDDATRRRAQEINVAAERCARIVKSFLAMARSKPVERKPADIDEIVDSVLELAGYGLRRSGTMVARRAASESAWAFVDADQIHQVVMNLVLNAQHALDGAEAPQLTIVTEKRGDAVRLTIADNGCGMDETVRARAFEPFFTTKPQGVGTGVGLSICHGIVTAHGGAIELTSAPGHGTRFEIALPAWTGDPSRDVAGAQGPALAGAILVVDDEPAIASLIRAAFRGDAVDVETETSSVAALARLVETPFDALLTDLRMPGLSGEELIAAALERRPELRGRIIAMTGDALGAGLPPEFGVTVLEKPLDLASLREALAAAIGAPTQARTPPQGRPS